MTDMNFANRAQRAAGINLTAAEYLEMEGIAHVALCVAVSNAADLRPGPETAAAMAAVIADGAPVGDAAEFEALVAAARPGWEAMGGGAEPDPAVWALANWFRAHGAEPGRACARLAAQLGWA